MRNVFRLYTLERAREAERIVAVTHDAHPFAAMGSPAPRTAGEVRV